VEKKKQGSVGGSDNTFLTLDIRNRYNIIITMQEEKRFCVGLEKEKKGCGESYTTPFKVLLNFNGGLKI
jgi:hypothetical protein